MNYYRLLFTNIFDKLSELNINSLILDNKLNFYNIKNFNDICIVLKSEYEEIEDDNILYLSHVQNTQFNKDKKVLIINYDSYVNIDEYSDNVTFLHVNNKNLSTSDIKQNYYNSKNTELINILYFTDINFIKFIERCFNVSDSSVIIILCAFIKIAIHNNNIPVSTKIDQTQLTTNEAEIINYLTQHNYIINLID